MTRRQRRDAELNPDLFSSKRLPWILLCLVKFTFHISVRQLINVDGDDDNDKMTRRTMMTLFCYYLRRVSLLTSEVSWWSCSIILFCFSFLFSPTCTGGEPNDEWDAELQVSTPFLRPFYQAQWLGSTVIKSACLRKPDQTSHWCGFIFSKTSKFWWLVNLRQQSRRKGGKCVAI